MNYWNSFAPYSTRYNYEGGGPPIEMDFPPFRPLRSFNESVYPTQQRDSKCKFPTLYFIYNQKERMNELYMNSKEINNVQIEKVMIFKYD